VSSRGSTASFRLSRTNSVGPRNTRIDTNEIQDGRGLIEEWPSFTSGKFFFFILKFAFIRVIRGRSMAAGPLRRSKRGAAAGRLLAFALGLAFIAFAGCRKQISSSGSVAQVLRISQRNEPGDLDPASATLPDEFFIIRALSEGLVSPAPVLNREAPATAVVPAAATHWDISADGRTYTFHLRPGALWSNGEPVTAQDFVAAYKRLLTPATAATKAALFSLVKNADAFNRGALHDFSAVGFRALDPLTLEVTLSRPAPEFLVYAASGPWIPVNPRTVEKFGRQWTRPENHIGNGPYTLAEWRPHQRIVVKKNPRYHSPSAAKLEEIQFIVLDNGDAEERAYRSGQIDVTMAVPVTKLDVYARERPAELHHAPLAETQRVLRGGQKPADHLVPNELLSRSAARAADLTATSANPFEARRLLAEAGFAEGKNFPELELSSWPIGPPVVEAVQQMWKQELGIEVRLVTREAKVHVAALREGQYDIGFITVIPDVPDAANVLADFATGAAGNYPHWSDQTFDGLLAKADQDPAERMRRLESAEARLLAECPVAPLYFNARNWLMSTRVRGWQSDALWTRFYLNVELSNP
jgi:oligopeptide transport system substrate-binding protein